MPADARAEPDPIVDRQQVVKDELRRQEPGPFPEQFCHGEADHPDDQELAIHARTCPRLVETRDQHETARVEPDRHRVEADLGGQHVIPDLQPEEHTADCGDGPEKGPAINSDRSNSLYMLDSVEGTLASSELRKRWFGHSSEPPLARPQMAI